MIGLDTNVLVRYITQDDPKQSSKANDLIENTLSAANQGVISKIVLCELSWVLSHSYKYSREQVASVIQQVLITQEFVVEDSGNAFKALQEYQVGKADFADFFRAQTHMAMGAKFTVSFDKKALKSDLFRNVQEHR